MNILHVSRAAFGHSHYLGGGERYVHSIAEAVEQAGSGAHMVTIAAMHDEPTITFAVNGIPTTVFQAEGSAGAFFGRISGGLWSLMETADLVHVHHPLTYGGEFGIVLARQLGKVVVATDTGGGHLTVPARQHPAALAQGILAISQFATQFVNHLGPPVTVIIGPVGQAFLDTPLNAGDRDIDALYVGRLLPHKGIHHLIRAAPRGLRVTIAGRALDPAYETRLRDLASGKSVTFAAEPSDADLHQLFSRAKVHVAPSILTDEWGGHYPKSELMGLTTLEAMASGTPVLVNRTGSLPELVEDCPFGRVYSGEGELRTCLEEVREGRWPPRPDPAACRLFAADRFSPALVGEKIVRFYEDAARNA